MVGFGAEHSEMMSRMDRLQMIIALAVDPPLWRNRVTIDRGGDPVVDYRVTDGVLRSLRSSIVTSTRIFFAAGALRVHAPGARKFLIEESEKGDMEGLVRLEELRPGKVSLASAHLMGGCRMGSDPEDSVTSQWGEVHGTDWLYVADSSLFPRCSEVNPYLTVMALADRVAERVRSAAQEAGG